MSEIVKICSIHGPLTSDQIRKDKRCKLCRSISNKKSYYKNPQKRIEYASKWKKENRDLINEQTRLDRINNPEKHKEWSRRGREKLGQFRNIREISRIRGITTDRYEEMLKKQKNLCAICFKPEKRKSRSGKISSLCLDHNHLSNKVREFLCFDCNTMIGNFKESIETIESAIKYLIKHGELCQK